MNYRNQHFSLRHRAIATLSLLFRNNIYTVRHGLIRGMRRMGGLGFLPGSRGQDDSRESLYFESLDFTGRTVYDVGAFEGLVTMYFSRSARQVVTYEPTRRNYWRAATNIALNQLDNVMLRRVGVGDHAEQVSLVYDPLMPGGASADSSVGGQISATSAAAHSELIQITTLDEDIPANRLPAPDYIKIDIEGMEVRALHGMEKTLREHHPTVYLEMHGAGPDDKTKNVRDVFTFLTALGYRSILHIESGRTLSEKDLAQQSHLCCCTSAQCTAVDGVEREHCPVKRPIYLQSITPAR